MNKTEDKKKESNFEEKLKDREILEGSKVKKEEYKNEPKEVKELQKEVEILKKDKLFLLAELDNKQKEFRRQVEEIYKYSNKKFILAVLDFLVDLEERALKSMRDDSEKRVQNHLVGIEMMRNNLWKILEKEGVKEIEIRTGVDLWNSSFHELVGEIEDEKFPERTIKEIQEKGYLLHGQVLRPAKVKISKKKTSRK